MVLAIIEDRPEQFSLPDPDTLPAWVHAALDRWDTSHATYMGLHVLKYQNPELEKAHGLERIENMAFKHLRYLASLWQYANFRTYVTSFEMQVLEAELAALKMPFALKRYVHQTMCRDSNGDPYWIHEETWQHDKAYIINFIQHRLGTYGAIMGRQQIKHTLEKLDAIYTVCEALGVEVQIYQSNQRVLRKKLQRTS
jgi:hypothetical protein